MPQYVALLRGINVGGHRVKMDRLRELFEELGLEKVTTVIASGNVIFSSKSKDRSDLRAQIEAHLAKELGFEAPTFLRTPAELGALKDFVASHDRASSQPWDSHYVMFLQGMISEELTDKLAAFGSDRDAFLFDDLEIHWRVRGRLSDSPLFGAVIDRTTRGTSMTMRNMQTIRRILRKTEWRAS